MNKAFALLIAAAGALSAPAFADDKTSPATTGADQGKMKRDAAASKGAYAKMTPDEKAALKTSARAEKQTQGDTIAKSGNTSALARGEAISKSAADSRAGPAPARGTLNTPESEKLLKQQRGQ